jgi:acyl-CoA thioester hydrolase
MDKRFEDCKVSITIPVAWGEMDAYQHVNNVVYFRYFESARLAYFEKIGVNKIKEESNIGPILASTQCRFKSPLLYPDTIHAATCITEIEEDRFTMKYFIKSEQQGRVVAEGEGLIVFYDYENSCKHVIPKAIREYIQSLDNLS